MYVKQYWLQCAFDLQFWSHPYNYMLIYAFLMNNDNSGEVYHL